MRWGIGSRIADVVQLLRTSADCPFWRRARWPVCIGPLTVRGVTWKPRAERGHRVRSDAIAPREGSHYVPDGTVHAVDDQTGEVACGFDSELIEIEAAWDPLPLPASSARTANRNSHGESVSADERLGRRGDQGFAGAWHDLLARAHQ
jgi:hypothetical protein